MSDGLQDIEHAFLKALKEAGATESNSGQVKIDEVVRLAQKYQATFTAGDLAGVMNTTENRGLSKQPGHSMPIQKEPASEWTVRFWATAEGDRAVKAYEGARKKEDDDRVAAAADAANWTRTDRLNAWLVGGAIVAAIGSVGSFWVSFLGYEHSIAAVKTANDALKISTAASQPSATR